MLLCPRRFPPPTPIFGGSCSRVFTTEILSAQEGRGQSSASLKLIHLPLTSSHLDSNLVWGWRQLWCNAGFISFQGLSPLYYSAVDQSLDQWPEWSVKGKAFFPSEWELFLLALSPYKSFLGLCTTDREEQASTSRWGKGGENRGLRATQQGGGCLLNSWNIFKHCSL